VPVIVDRVVVPNPGQLASPVVFLLHRSARDREYLS